MELSGARPSCVIYCSSAESVSSSFAMMVASCPRGTREIMLTRDCEIRSCGWFVRSTILYRHVLKLISIPIVTVFGLQSLAPLTLAFT